jgi:hypothetical protein
MPEKYPPMPTPLPKGAPVNPFPQQKVANDAWSKSWIARGKWAIANPKLSGYIKPTPDVPEGNNNNNDNPVKAGTDANFLSLVFSALPDYNIEEELSLKSLTGNEILQVAHRQNFYTNNEVLNRNIVDLVESRNIYSATEIIKLQKPDYSYLFQNNFGAYNVSLTSSRVSIEIPISVVSGSSKIQVETFTPREIKDDTIYL